MLVCLKTGGFFSFVYRFHIYIYIYLMMRNCLLVLRLVKVILVEDEGVGEDVSQQSGQRCLAAGGTAADADDDGFPVLHGLFYCILFFRPRWVAVFSTRETQTGCREMR